MLGLSDCETGCDIVAWMTGDTADVGIVQVEVAEGGAIGESCEIRRGLPRRANDGRATAAIGESNVTAYPHRLFVKGGKRTTDGIDQVDFDAFDRFGVEVFITKGRSVVSEALRERCLRSG